MTLCVCTITYQGIVIAADSRQTYINSAKMPRIGSEYGQKVFLLNNWIGATSYGWAFLLRKNIAGLIEDFKVNLPSQTLTVEETARRLVDFFEDKYSQHINAKLDEPVAQGLIAIGFIVAGYNEKSSIGEVYACQIPGRIVNKITDTNNPGCAWNGQGEIVQRLVKGHDAEIDKLKGFNHELQAELPKLELTTNFNNMTIQDAIDYCIFLIRTTIDAQRFSDGIALHPGSIPGVGGSIDVAVMQPGLGFKWVQLKELTAEKSARRND
jgi:hypothetical protein